MSWLKRLQMPHVFALLTFMVLLGTILTWVVPSGSFQREELKTPAGTRNVVIPGTFSAVDKVMSLRGVVLGEVPPEGQAAPVSLVGFLSAIPRGLEKSADIVFFIFIVGGVFGVIQRTGTVTASIRKLLDHLGHSAPLLTIVIMVLVGIGGSTLGMGEEFIPLVPVFLIISKRLGYDRIYGLALVMLAADIGFASATTNPFTVNIAQGIAELELNSGIGLRAVFFCCCMTVTVLYVLRYGARIKRDPSASLMGDDPFEIDLDGVDDNEFSTRHAVIVVLCMAIFAGILVAVQQLGWWLNEMAGGFILMGLVAAAVARLSPNATSKAFVHGASEMVVAALVVGFARAIQVVLEDGQVLDTVIYAAASRLEGLPRYVSVEAMLLFQAVLNFAIPSGSGQAAVTMPLMAPLSDLLGITRQTAVLAYQCGDGFSNTVVPTSGILMAMLSLAGIPYGKWLRFMLPLLCMLLVISAIFLAIAVAIDYE